MFTILKKQSAAFLCLFLFLFTSLQGATIHAILVGDTNDRTLGVAMQMDLDMMHKELSEASRITGLKYNVIMTTGRSVNADNILNQIDQLKIEPDDVVVAYFSCHGYRTSSKTSRWPNVFFSNESRGIELDLIVDILSQKNPRLLIVMADSCNNVINGIPTVSKPKKSAKARALTRQQRIKQNYTNLFVKSSGVIILSGSIPGQFSWGVNNRGCFTTLAFIDELKNAVTGIQPASWEGLLGKLESRISTLQRPYGENVVQTPQYEINLTAGK